MPFQAPWLNNGEPIEVRPLPFRGIQELGKLRKAKSDLRADYGQILAHYTWGTILAVERMCEEVGPEAAKKAWEQHMEEMGLSQEAREEMTFPVDNFAEEWSDFVDQRVRKNVDQLEGESLKDAVQRNLKDLTSRVSLEQIRYDLYELEMQEACVEFYWRHKNSNHTITPEEGEELPLTVENLMDVMSFEDWGNYQAALTEAELRKAAGPEEQVNSLLDPDTRDELKKSSQTS